MALESFPPGFFLKKEEPVKVMEDPVEPPVEEEVPVEPEPPIEEPPVEEEPVEEEPAEEEPEPEPLPAPFVPTLVHVDTFETTTKVAVAWKYQSELGVSASLTGVTFAIFFNDVQHSTVFEKTAVEIPDLPLGDYIFQVKAINVEGTPSELSEPFAFTVREPAGVNNANYWLPSKIDNLSVTYRK